MSKVSSPPRPLPVGEYDVLITEYPRDNLAQDRTRYPVPDVFLHQKLQIEAGQATQSMEIHAVPHVGHWHSTTGRSGQSA
jgi:hypothetical protein